MLIEREYVLGIMSAALKEAQAGAGRLILICGEAGIGKSSVVEHFAAGQKLPVAWGNCEPMAAIGPLEPFREIAQKIGGPLGKVFADRATNGPHPTNIFGALDATPGVLLIIEDLQWADEATLNAIRHIGRRIHQLKILLIATYRDDEIGPTHPIRGVLGALATSSAVIRLVLEPLSTVAVARLAQDQKADVDTLFQQTGGNPFLVTELLSSSNSGIVPGAIRDMVIERVSRLSDQHRVLIMMLAVIGRAEPAVLRQLPAAVTEAVEAGIAVGLLRESSEPLVFRHELTRRAVLQSIGHQRARLIHEEVLNLLVALGETDSARLAEHAVGADNAEAALKYATLAARLAVAGGARREAAVQYLRALKYADAQERASLLLEYGQVCAALGRHDEAIQSLREAAGLFQNNRNSRGEGAALTALVGPLSNSGLIAEANTCSRQSISVLEPLGSSRELAEALRSEAHQRMLARDKVQALHYGRRAIVMADAVGDVATLTAANQTVGTALLVADDPEGRRYLDRSIHLAITENLDIARSIAYLNAGSAYAEQYHFSVAEDLLNQGIAFAGERDFDGHLHYMRAWTALLQLYQGQFSRAIKTAQDVLSLNGLATISRIMSLVALGRAYARLGMPDVTAILDEAMDLATLTGSLQRLAPVRLARAEAAWLAGELERSGTEAEKIWGLAIGHRHQWHAGEAAYWQRGHANGHDIPDWVARPYRLELAGDWACAAAAWEAIGCPYEQARALSNGDVAAQKRALTIFDQLGTKPAAEQLRHRMRQSGIQSVPRGPRGTTQTNQWGLTIRQDAILRLVAEGMTNNRIAKRLNISEKTVDHHVSAVLAKLDVSTRAEAVLVLVQATQSQN